MDESILTSVKKYLGITEDYEHFDADIIMHINTVFTILQQIGVGPEEGFSIRDKTTTWSEYIQNENLFNSVREYIYLRVRLLFDHPSNSFVADSIRKDAGEIEWRLNLTAENN